MILPPVAEESASGKDGRNRHDDQRCCPQDGF
jgi:hypothetical protein